MPDTGNILGELGFISGPGETARLIRARDWSRSCLGPPDVWPAGLKAAVGLLIHSNAPMVLLWGRDGAMLYNDAFSAFAGARASSLGAPVKEGWPEIAGISEEIMEAGFRGGTLAYCDLEITVSRSGGPEQVFMNLDCSPVYSETGAVAGVLAVVVETTRRVRAERQASGERELLLQAFEQAPGFIIVMRGPDHVVEYVNASHRRLFESGGWIGRPLRDAFPSVSGQGVFEALDAVFATGERFSGTGVAVSFESAAFGPKTERFLDFVYEPMCSAAGDVVGIMCEGSDVTDRIRAEAARARGQALASAQARVLDLAVRNAPLAETLGTLARTVEELTASDVLASVLLLDEDGLHLRHGAAPSLPKSYNDAIDGIAVGPAVGSCGTAVHRRETVIVSDIATDPLWADFRDLALAEGLRACWSVPIMSGQGTVLGTFALYHHEPREALPSDLELLEFVALSTGVVLERAQADAAIRASEARYRQIVEGAEDFAIVTLDAEGIIRGWNAGAERIVGYAASEALGQRGSLLFTDEDRMSGAFGDEMDSARTCGRAVDERWHQRKNGSLFWGSGLTMPLDGLGGGYLKIFRDRTSEHKAEAAVRHSEAKLRALNVDLERQVAERTLARGLVWELTPDLMGVLNTDGHWEASNPAWRALLGWSEAEVAATNFLEFVHPEDLARTEAAWRGAAERGLAATHLENRYRAKDGRWCWISWIAVPDGAKVYCIGRDVSADRLHAEELASRTAERDRAWKNSRDLQLVVDLQGVFRAVNNAWTTILGYATEELVGRFYLDLIHPDDVAASQQALATATRGALPVYENRYRHKDGGWRWISWVAAPEGDAIYASGRDVSAEKQKAAELEAAQDALRQSQKMEAMGQLTGGVAHDFNNLLTPIVGGLDMLQRRGLGGEREQRLIAGAVQSADRARTLVQRLLAFARRQPLQPVAVDISQLVTGMGDLVSSTTGPQIRVVVDAPEELPLACADPNQIEMALLNLSVNARDAMPRGGTLRISAGADEVGADHYSGLKPGTYIRLSVADTGGGMDELTLARAVEPFFSTKGVGKGTGLGLSMVHGLASQLGGALAIQSQKGVGTNVELWLPQATAPREDVERKAGAPHPHTHRGTALLVDDEELVRLSTSDMLKDLGYVVVEVSSAEEALALLQEQRSFDLVVTDHLMPGMNGSDLAREMRSAQPGLPVLLVSGYADHEGVDSDLPRLSKPFRIDELASTLSQMG